MGEDISHRPVLIRRAVCEGSTLLGLFRPSEYRLTSLNASKLYIARLTDAKDYERGCSFHKRCSGHLCQLPSGVIVMPHFVARGEGMLRNMFVREVEQGFRQGYDQASYNEFLASKMLTKTGILRYECMGGVIDGSLRSVIVSCWEVEPNEICIPAAIASNMRFPCRPTSTDGGKDYISPGFQYRALREGDFAIVVRPPSLWQGSCQPMRVVLWERECIGLSPFNCSQFNADFDGDEVQVYPVAEPASVLECTQWTVPSDRTLDLQDREAGEIPGWQHRDSYELSRTFMAHSTVTMQHVLSNGLITPLMVRSGLKASCSSMCSEMPEGVVNAEDPSLVASFYLSSRVGLTDIMQQQLTQGEIGRITRLARVGCSMSGSVTGGAIPRATAEGVTSMPIAPSLLNRLDATASLGMPCMRAVSSISRKAQQSALDSHKATVNRAPRFDAIHSLVQNADETMAITRVIQPRSGLWSMPVGQVSVTVGKVESIASLGLETILGAYHPKLLALYGDYDHRQMVCYRALRMLCRYYSVIVVDSDTVCLAALLASSGAEGHCALNGSPRDIATRRWLDRVIGTSFNELARVPPDTLNARYSIESLIEAAFFGRFKLCL